MGRSNDSEREVIEQLEGEGWTVHTRGWPDILAEKDGALRFIEVKPKGSPRLSKHQAALADALRLLGVEVELWTTRQTGVTPAAVRELGHRRPSRVYLIGQRSAGRVTVSRTHGRIHVSCPYHREFVQAAGELGGRYRPVSKLWSFRLSDSMKVLELVGLKFDPSVVDILS